jgi:aminoglycoside phosphotransferase (APT) family kinase protein
MPPPDFLPGVDVARLGAWMDEAGLPPGPISGGGLLGGGTQNIIVRFDRGGYSYVLRRPPLHKRGNSDETMRREARVLAALATTDVPHARLVAACADEGVLGAAFYLMEHVEGANPTAGLPQGYHESPAWRHRLGLAIVEGIAALGQVDHQAVGLGDFGRVDGYLERQVARWLAQMDGYRALAGYPGPDVPELEEIGGWLDANRPDDFRPGLVHGDYHLANVLVASDRPAVAAIVDWELASIGDPLLDLAGLLVTWPPPEGPRPGAVGIEPWNGFPTGGELLEHYGELTGRDLGSLRWYEVLYCFKMGIILEGTYARACAGQADMAVGERLLLQARRRFAHALCRIGTS